MLLPVTVINNSSVSGGVNATLTIVWGIEEEEEPDGYKIIIMPSFPLEYKISDYTPDENYYISAGLINSGEEAIGYNQLNTSDGGNYESEIILEDAPIKSP
ncbi:MAG: hypothetical protein JXB88_17570 [Spirochaetales bacterium]|nr:hypothetical protein [Spirochaetales bacterium]